METSNKNGSTTEEIEVEETEDFHDLEEFNDDDVASGSNGQKKTNALWLKSG